MRAIILMLALCACAQVRGDTGGTNGALAVTINPLCHVLCFGYGPKHDTDVPVAPK